MKTRFRRIIARLLQAQVKQLIARYDLTVIAVGGSIGKTSTKSAIATVLEVGFPGKVLSTPGNYNTEIALPLSVFQLPVPKQLMSPVVWLGVLQQMRRVVASGAYPYKYLVLELGIDHPGEMADFIGYLSPDIGVVTAIAPEHLEYFGSLDVVAQEEFKLALGSKQAVLNADDDRLRDMADQLTAKPILFGDRGNIHFVESFVTDNVGLGGSLHLPDNDVVTVQTHIIAEHGLYAVYAAVAVGFALGMPPEPLQAGVEAIAPVHGRMNPLKGKHGTLIIDDTYNSSPDAALAALATLAKLSGRHIAVLGSMNELGNASEEAHRLVGDACGGLDMLITIGADANSYIAPQAIEAGLASDAVHSFNSPYAAGKFVLTQLKAGDVVLAKGSQNGVFAEEAIKPLLATKDDAQKLVRQSPEWMGKKRAQFGDA